MADTPTVQDGREVKSVPVARQDALTPEDAKRAQEQAKVMGGADASINARVISAEAARQQAVKEDEAKGLVFGIPKQEYDGMNLGQQRRIEMNYPYSDLRNQVNPQDEVDYQILSNTNAYTIEAMTGVPLPKLIERAKELGVSLKDTAAGNGGPGTGNM